MTLASSMMKQSLYPKLLHVTCLCHALHRVCEDVRRSFPAADRLINDFKIVFARSSRRVNLLQHHLGKPLPSFPVCTRWGTWIEFCLFLIDSYDQIKDCAASFKDEDCASIQPLLEALDSADTKLELSEIFKLRGLPATIKSLEERGLSVIEQKELIEKEKERLPPRFRSKLEACLDKNPDIEKLFAIEDLASSIRFLFAPLVSVDVERSFSQFKCIITDRRTGFTAENFVNYAVVHFNSFLNQ